MNRSQFVFVLLVNVLVTVVLVSVGFLLYEHRSIGRQIAAVPEEPQVAMPAEPAPTAVPTVAAAAAVQASGFGLQEGGGARAPRTYTVQAGDSLGAIAETFGVSQGVLASANGIVNPDLITPGQILVVPSPDAVDEGRGWTATADSFAIEILNAGTYASEVIVIVNASDQPVSLANWTVSTSLDEEYRFDAMAPLSPGDSIRLMSRAGTDTAYDKFWGRTPREWTIGTTITFADATGTQVVLLEISPS
ncbi:MAG: LysM peptidoglycan-binding domain-containing protein [Caldilineaceae bacterium]|nr:LysM peptidoglycan-binding domain-containing protein [Caldilineaceae bacterium]